MYSNYHKYKIIKIINPRTNYKIQIKNKKLELHSKLKTRLILKQIIKNYIQFIIYFYDNRNEKLIVVS